MIFALDGTEILVAIISTVGIVLVGLLTNEGRKARKTLGERGPEDPSFMDLMVGLYADVKVIKVQTKDQERRLASIETTVDVIDGRVVHLEDLAGIQHRRGQHNDQQRREAQ